MEWQTLEIIAAHQRYMKSFVPYSTPVSHNKRNVYSAAAVRHIYTRSFFQYVRRFGNGYT